MKGLVSLLTTCCLGAIPAGHLQAQEDVSPTPSHVAGFTGGLVSWSGEGEAGHVSLSFEDHWASGLVLAAEGGFVFARQTLVGTLTPGIMVNFTPDRESSPFARGGFSLVGSNVGFHVGGGFNMGTLDNGLRFEGRVHFFPGEESDYMLEALITYQLRF